MPAWLDALLARVAGAIVRRLGLDCAMYAQGGRIPPMPTDLDLIIF